MCDSSVDLSVTNVPAGRIAVPFVRNYVARARRKLSDLKSVSRRSLHLEMRHRDDRISLLVAPLNMLESFRDLFQGITSVDDRLELSGRGKLRDESHSFQVVDGHAAPDLLPAGDTGPNGPKHISQTHDAGKKDALGLQ